MTSHVVPGLEARLALAETIGREAGAMALDFFARRETLIIETKRDPQDLVSIADREVENLIRDRIAEAYPEDGVLGEEYGLVPGRSGFTWAVDPIDGTSPFVNGMPNWCVSIALVHAGIPVVGVIAAPCHGELYAAALGLGARLNGKALTLDGSRTIRNHVTGLGANNYVKPAFVGQMVESLLEAGGTSCATVPAHLCLPMWPPAVWWAITNPTCTPGTASPAIASSRKRAAGTCPFPLRERV